MAPTNRLTYSHGPIVDQHGTLQCQHDAFPAQARNAAKDAKTRYSRRLGVLAQEREMLELVGIELVGIAAQNWKIARFRSRWRC